MHNSLAHAVYHFGVDPIAGGRAHYARYTTHTLSFDPDRSCTPEPRQILNYRMTVTVGLYRRHATPADGGGRSFARPRPVRVLVIHDRY